MTQQTPTNTPSEDSPAGSPAAETAPVGSTAAPRVAAADNKPPHGPRLRYLILAVIVAAATFGVGYMWANQWQWPVKSQAKAPAATGYWTCGMHPWLLLTKPGLCPICHMDLVPVDADTVLKQGNSVYIDPAMVQNIGVRTAQVVAGPVTSNIRTVGTIDYDETAVRDVALKIDGYIEKLFVDTTGQQVKKGQPLFEMYSPELNIAQNDYLLSLRSGNYQQADAIVKRLQSLDVSDDQIQALAKSNQVSRTLLFKSPYEGLVISKDVVQGTEVKEGMKLYRIANLSKVWAMVTIYEYQLPFVQVGQKAAMSLPYIPNQKFEGKVTYVYPYLSTELRQAKVRLEFDNPNGLLKPGMFANVELSSTLADNRLLVPRDAVIDTGQRKIAFVSLGSGRFEPRDVTVGVEAQDGMLEIRDGLKEGQTIVTSAQFLLDSESNIRDARMKMLLSKLATSQPARPEAPAGAAAMPAEARKALASAIDGYLAIHDRLFSDKIDDLATPARQIVSAVDNMLNQPVPGDEGFWRKHQDHMGMIRSKALELTGANDILKIRIAFADLSVALSKFVQEVGTPPELGKDLTEYTCGMFHEGQGGGIWVQAEGNVQNPYFGQKMPECFSAKKPLPAMKSTATAPATAPAADSDMKNMKM